MKIAPRLLFLAYYFPPVRAIACVRTWAMAKHLSRRGWQVTVMTPKAEYWNHTDNSRQFENACARERIVVRRTSHRMRFLVGDFVAVNKPLVSLAARIIGRLVRMSGREPMLGWEASVLSESRDFSVKAYDVILASGWPFLSFRLARELASKVGCPYVLDYRDLWTGNPHARWLNTRRNRRQELRLLRESGAVVVVSPSMVQSLENAFHHGRLVHVLTNGYDPEDLGVLTPRQFPTYSIVYAGGLYPPIRTLDPILRALALLLERAPDEAVNWRLHYFGTSSDLVRDAAAKYKVDELVLTHGRVSRGEALSAVAGADVTVVVTSVRTEATVEEQAILTGKLFESIALARHILLIAPPSSDAGVIIRDLPNARRFSGTEAEGMASFLKAIGGRERPTRNEPPVDYSWPRLGERLDGILHGAMRQ